MLLSVVVFLPALAALGLLFVKKDALPRIRAVGVGAAAATLLFSLLLAARFRPGPGGDAFASSSEWMPSFGVRYAIGLDGIGLLLVLLTTSLSLLTLLASFSSIRDRVRDFVFWFLLLETFMLGTVASRDLFLFFVFWELLLLPMLFIIGRWGGERRVYAALKFFIYTMVGSLPMMAALAYLYFRHRAAFPAAGPTFLLEDFKNLKLGMEEQCWCFAGFALSFAIKIPLWPVHTWLPDAHTEAPTPGSMILAGVLLKLGGFGFLLIAMPLFPDATRAAAPLMLTLSVIGVVAGALVAMVQPDLKRLVAYSSVSHMGLVTLGLFALNREGLSGAVLQMVAHGVSTGALFLLVGMVYERRHTRLIAAYGGIAKSMPRFAVVFLIVTFSSVALPLTNGFPGELLILAGAFKASPVAAAFAVSGAILGAWYMLGAVRRVFFGPLTDHHNSELKDLTRRELWLVLPFVVAIVLCGVRPQPMLDLIEKDAARIEAAVARSILPAPGAQADGGR
jgi:NADH-quinone oxidoreductase subunit M